MQIIQDVANIYPNGKKKKATQSRGEVSQEEVRATAGDETVRVFKMSALVSWRGGVMK